MRESVIEREVVRHAVGRGFLVRKVAWIGRIGAPDRVFMRDGKVIWVEFKATGEPLKPHQEREIERLRNAGMTVRVIDEIEAGCALFD